MNLLRLPNARDEPSNDGELTVIEIRGAGPPLTGESLTSFERELGTSLPDPYRRFLLRNNGGRPPLEKDTVDVDGLPGGVAAVLDFFGLGDPIESCDLRWNRETLSERIPDNLLPIACDSSGNDFCLSLQGADRGAVLYCDLQSVYCNFEADPDFYPVAPDFDSFLSKLREFPDEEPTGADKG